MYICYPTNLDEYLKKQFKEEEKDFALLCKQIYYLFEKVLMYCHPSFNHLNNTNHNNHLNNNLNNSLQNMTQKSIMVLKNDKLNTLTLYFFFILDYNKLYNEYQLQFTKRNELTNITVAITLQYLSTTNNYNHNNNYNNNELTTKKGQYNNTEEENNQLDDETLQSLLKHTQIKEGMNVKEFCEYYIKIMNSNNKISKRILKVFKEINNSKFDGNFKIKVFKNCTIVPRFDDSFIICKNILSVCKLGLFDKNAKKGLNLEQLEYLKGLRPDKPFFTLLERMESLQREIIIPLFQFMIYCHRYLNCTIYHLLLKDFIFFKLNSFTTISNNIVNNNIINNNNNCNNKTNKTRKIIVNNDTKNGNNSDNNSSSSSPSCLLSAFTTMTCGSSSSSSSSSPTSSPISSPVLSTSTFCGEIDSNNNNINNNLIVKESKEEEEEEDCNNNCKEEEEEEKDSLIIEKIIERKEVIFIMSSLCKKMELNNRSLLIQTDIFQLAILFLEFITGTNPQNVCLTNNEEVNDYVSGMLKQLHCSIDYLRQTSIQFENSLFSKPINDQHKVKLMCERFAHLQTLLFCLSNFEKMITEMIEYKTHAFKDLFCLFDAKKMQEMIENTCDCLFKEKIEGCQIVKQTKEIISLQPIQLKVSVKQFHQEKKRQLEEKSRNILSNVNNNNCQPNFISRPPLSDITNNQQNKTLLENNSAFDDDDCSPNIVGESKQLKRKFNSSSQQKDGRLKVQKSATTATLLLNNVAASSNHNKASHHHAVKQQDKEN
ncbi:hypothetical protein ABK040_006956 [Willaertia magna]